MFPIRDTAQSRSFPIVTWLIIVANVAAFLLEVTLGQAELGRFTRTWGMVPARLLGNIGLGQIATIFTSMFLHGGWFHLISNMWALYIFGDNVEDRMGHVRFLLFYLLCGVAAAAAHVWTGPESVVPVIGASGALSGILGAYLILFPTARVITLVPLLFLPWFVEIPAVLYLVIWFVSQLFNGLFSLGAAGTVAAYGGVAWWAHVGGFVAGLVLVKLFERRRAYPRWYADEYWPW